MWRVSWKFYIKVTQMWYLENYSVIIFIVKRPDGTHLSLQHSGSRGISVSSLLVAVRTEHRNCTLPVWLEPLGRDNALGLRPQWRHLRTPVTGVHQEIEKGIACTACIKTSRAFRSYCLSSAWCRSSSQDSSHQPYSALASSRHGI